MVRQIVLVELWGLVEVWGWSKVSGGRSRCGVLDHKVVGLHIC